MKTFKLLPVFLAALFSFHVSFSQQPTALKSQTVKVWGECSKCKKTIESSAITAGASKASWNTKTKMLSISYNAGQTDVEKIEQAIAAAGYDTRDFAADSAAYKSLDECCQYDRKETSAPSPTVPGEGK